jgi:hypothetical protein
MFSLLHQFTKLTYDTTSESNVFSTDQGPVEWPNIVTYMTTTPTFNVEVIFNLNCTDFKSLIIFRSAPRRPAATPSTLVLRMVSQSRARPDDEIPDCHGKLGFSLGKMHFNFKPMVSRAKLEQ